MKEPLRPAGRGPTPREDYAPDTIDIELPHARDRAGQPVVVRIRRLSQLATARLATEGTSNADLIREGLVEPGAEDEAFLSAISSADYVYIAGAISRFALQGVEEVTAMLGIFPNGHPGGNEGGPAGAPGGVAVPAESAATRIPATEP